MMPRGATTISAGRSAIASWRARRPLEIPGTPFESARVSAGTASGWRPSASRVAHGGRSTRTSSGGGFGASDGFSIARTITYPM